MSKIKAGKLIEWVSKEGWELFNWNNGKWQKIIAYRKRPDNNIYQYATTPELIELFLSQNKTDNNDK